MVETIEVKRLICIPITVNYHPGLHDAQKIPAMIWQIGNTVDRRSNGAAKVTVNGHFDAAAVIEGFEQLVEKIGAEAARSACNHGLDLKMRASVKSGDSYVERRKAVLKWLKAEENAEYVLKYFEAGTNGRAAEKTFVEETFKLIDVDDDVDEEE